VGECFFWYWLTRVVPDKIQRAMNQLCVCVCVHARLCVHARVCVRVCVRDSVAVQAGEVVMLESWVNGEWMTGAAGNGRGMFPVNFVEIVEPLPSQPTILASRLAVMYDCFLFHVKKICEFVFYLRFNGRFPVELGYWCPIGFLRLLIPQENIWR